MTLPQGPDSGAWEPAVTFAEAEARLLNRWPENKVAPSLDRISEILNNMGEPQFSAPVIHVAGTNGKTTTARVIEVLCRSYGITTGLFTSPSLNSITERIQLNGSPISEEAFVRAFNDCSYFFDLADADAQQNGTDPVTMFEAMTALAFAAFADAPVDIMIFEVGMGGTWDATNVVQPAVSVIMPIGMDHMDYLGDTLAEIAGEKAGIIKQEVPVVIANQPEEAEAVLLAQAAELDAPVIAEDKDFFVTDQALAVGGQLVTVQTPAAVYPELFMPIHGEHQAHNLAAGLTAVETLFQEIFADRMDEKELNPEVIQAGLNQLVSPGRLERVRTSPTVIVDAAHNPAGIKASCKAIAESFGFSGTVGVLAVFADKDALGMVQAMAGYIDQVVITQNSSPRAMPADDLYEIAQLVYDPENVFLEADLPDALDRAVALADDYEPNGTGGIVALGSVVTAADVRNMLAPLPPYPPAPEVIEEEEEAELVDGELSAEQIMEQYLEAELADDTDDHNDEDGRGQQ